jgi:hypothetical protein
MSFIPFFSAAATTASRRRRPFAPVLIVAVEPENDWKYTVPELGIVVTSLKPHTRRIFCLEAAR